MPFILRKIRRNRWYLSTTKAASWLAEGDIQADSLADLTTRNNELSTWYIEDDKSNLYRIIVALAANCDYVSNFDYALLDMELLINNKFKLQKSKGVSADEEANNIWHRDLIELSAFNLAKLATKILNDGETKRIQEKAILKLIIEAVSSGQIDRNRLSENFNKRIDKLGSS